MYDTSLKSGSLLKRSTPLRQQPEWLRQGILLGNRFHYRQKNPLVHNSLNLSIAILLLAVMLGICSLGMKLPAFLFFRWAVWGSV